MRRLVNPIAFLVAAVLIGSAFAIEVVPLPGQPPDIPHGHLPPSGACRIWMPNEPPGRQPPPGSCEALASTPAGTWVLYRETPGTVVVTAYHPGVAGLVLDTEVFDLGE